MSIAIVDVHGVPDPLPDALNVLDVREDLEWVNGHIEGATHIPLREIPSRLDEVPETQTLVVCKVGARSAQAVVFLQARGRNVVNLEGGMLDWEAAGRPMVSENGSAPTVV